jgi:hypothetical protein
VKGFEKSPVAKAPQEIVERLDLNAAVNMINDELLRSLLS